MPNRILVTGGAGYIGSVVTAQLIARGDEVTIYDNFSNSSRASAHPKATLIVADTSDVAALDKTFSQTKFDAVIHFAASIEAGESMKVPEKFFRNNTANTLNLLEVMHAHKVPRIVFSSTAALYGTPERTPIEETDKLQPTNTYGESKLLVER